MTGSQFKKYGFLYVLAALFILFIVLQFVFMVPINGDPIAEFWAAVFENQQSEMFQLLLQGLGMYVWSKWMFKKAEQDADEIKARLSKLEPPPLNITMSHGPHLRWEKRGE